MAWVWLMWRRVVATVLVLTLALLLAPTPQAVAKTPPKLPGFAADQDAPPGTTPLGFEYPSANGLSGLDQPSTVRLDRLPPRPTAGTEDHLYKSWKAYQEQRAPVVAHPLNWADYRDAYIRVFNNRNVGTGFETALDQELKFTENGYFRNKKIRGVNIDRRPDFHNDDEIVEIKTGVVDKDQYRDFIRIAQQTGRRVVYLFQDKPPVETLQEMMDIAREMGFADGVSLRHFPALGTAKPPGTGPLASSTQKPSAGSADQTTGASPANAEVAIEQGFVGGQVNTDMDAEEAAQDPASGPEPEPASEPGSAPAPQAPASEPGSVPAPQAPASVPGSVPAPRAPGSPSGAQTPHSPLSLPANPGAVVGPLVDAGVKGGVAAAKGVAGALGAAIGGAAGAIPRVMGGLVGGAAAAAGAAAGAAGGVGRGVASGVGGFARGVGGVLGGVDFSTLELRYIADTNYNGTGVRYAFAANTQTGTAPSFGGEDNSYMASDAFFVWLALPPQSFTVNLMPNEPDRIIDAQFGRTDAGRVLLEADFTMKRATARLIDPATPFGHDFLMALKGGKCFSAQRKWIVPLPASVAQQGDSMYLLDAPLDVKLEILGDDLKPGIGCPSQDAAITRQNDDLYRTTILPKIVDEVNHAPEYADLRRVYASRVAAEWYRQRSATKTTAYKTIINSGNIDAWTARQPWDPKEVFTRYRKSFYEGDATYTWKADERTTWTTTIGGVDFTNIPMVNLTPADFTKDHPALPATATNSLFGARLLNSGQQVWLGGLTSERPMTEVWTGDPAVLFPMPKSLFGTSLSPIMYAAITLPLAAWIGGGGVVWWRRRRAASFVGRR